MTKTQTELSPFSGMPWWVKAIAVVGFPIALSIVLLWFNQVAVANTLESLDSRTTGIESVAHDNNQILKGLQESKDMDSYRLALMCNSLVEPSVKSECWRGIK